MTARSVRGGYRLAMSRKILFALLLLTFVASGLGLILPNVPDSEWLPGPDIVVVVLLAVVAGLALWAASGLAQKWRRAD